MASIVNVLGRQRLSLGKDELIWGTYVGTSWQRLRIAIRMAMTGTVVGGELAVGVSQGTAQGWTHPTPTDALGVVCGTSSPSWGTGGVSPVYFFNLPAGYRIISKIGGSVTTQTGGGNSTFFIGSSFGVSWYVVDFVKPGLLSASPQMKLFFDAGTPMTDCSDDSTWHYSLEGTARAFNETGGETIATITGYTGNYLWDSIFLSWNQESPTVEVLSMHVIRFS